MEEKDVRYRKMYNLRNNFMKLMELCKVDGKEPEVSLPSPIRGFIERLISDGGICRYLDELDFMTKDAIKNMRNINLELWNFNENEAGLEKAQYENEALRKENEKLNKDNEALQKDNEALQKEKAALQEKNEADNKANEAFISGMIELRDNLYARKDWLVNEIPDNSPALKLVDGELKSTRILMEKAGITVMEDSGPFDGSRHTAVTTVKTDDPSLNNTIESVFRPGYAFGGEVIRGQEVSVYVAE